MTSNSVPYYESDLFQWAEQQQDDEPEPIWPRNSYNTVDVSNEEFDYEMYKRRIAWQEARRAKFEGKPDEPPPPPKPEFTSLMEYMDDFMPGLLEQADLMHETWKPVHEEDAAIRAFRTLSAQGNRRMRIFEAGGNYTPNDIADIFDLQDGRCCYCGMPFHDRKDFHIDHFTPISKGGDNSPANIVLACVSCNLSKSDHLFEDWRALRGWY